MAKLTSFKLVKKEQWEGLIQKIEKHEKEIISATSFIKQIEQGNLESNSDDQADQHSLTGSLVTMRNKMKAIAQEEKERNWITEGLARFSEILRSNNNDLTTLSDQIISELIKYMQANQGGLYLINSNDKEDVHIELIACYAYDRKKHINQRIELGQGLVGQAALEKDTIYISDVPKDYVRITSGLGEALPRSIIIVPLKLEENVYGLVELASFQLIKEYQIQFLEKLSETLAATIATVKTAEQTQILLKESRVQAEQLREQEEEMRQNMEELNATQEAMLRKQQETLEQSNKLNAVLDSTVDAIITINEQGLIESVNKAFTDLFFYTTEEILGKNINTIVPSPHHEKHDQYLRNYLTTGNAKIIGATRQMEARKKSGALFPIELAVNVADLGNRKIFTGIIRDITERIKAEQEVNRVNAEVHKNEKEVNELLNASSDSVITLDREYKVVRFNQAFVETLQGMNAGKGFDMMKLFGPEEQKAKKELYNRIFAGESIELIDHSTITGKATYHNVKHVPLFDADGKVNSIAIYVSDITELYQAKEKAELLVTEAQQQTEELRAQEEELRQNMEEMQAIQEDMRRTSALIAQNEKEVSELLNVSTDSILTVDKELKVLRFNNVFANSFPDLKIEKGFEVLSMFANEEDRNNKKKIYLQAFSGKVVETLDHINVGDYDNYFRVTHSPIFNTEGVVTSVAVYASDITELHNAKQKAEFLASEAQQQTEELRAQEEELRQNMEEMQAIQEDMRRTNALIAQNEKEVSELLNVSTDSILTVDKDLKVLRFNKVFANSFPDLKIEKGFEVLTMFAKEEDRKNKKKIYLQAFSGKVVETIDHVNVGDYDNYFRVTHSPIFNTEGIVTSIAVYASDITELHKSKANAEKSALESKEQELYYNNIIEGMTDLVATVDKDLNIIVANSAFKKIFSGYGLSTGSDANMLALAKGNKEAEKALKEPYMRAFKGENVEIPHRHHFDRDFQVSYNPLRDTKGNIIGVSLIAHDITERLKMLTDAQQQAEELRAQEEGMKQNMEELQTIQEELNRKNVEIEKAKLVERDRADAVLQSQKKNMQNIMTRFKQLEAEYKKRIEELENNLNTKQK